MPRLVMLVDDDKDVRDALAELLREEGYEVTVASSGRDALSQLEAGVTPSLMLVDVMMPEMDGFELCERCSPNPRLLPVPRFLLTATPHLEERAAKASALGILEKPVAVERLLEVVQRFAD